VKEEIKRFFCGEGIEYFAALPLSECHIVNQHLLSQTGVSPSGSALCFLVPYYGGEGKNISAYAVSKDYHLYFKTLLDSFCELLHGLYPEYDFFGFSDHSPISEVHAAARCGLGVVGDNRLLINEKYSSYVFIGEVISSMPAEHYGIAPRQPFSTNCGHCGKCISACPTGALSGAGVCLSALTQKKGALTPEEENIISLLQSAWGCDICQKVCPHTERAHA